MKTVFAELQFHVGSTLSIMGIVVGTGIGDPGSNPERGCFHFTLL